nr:OTU domain-containing protein At3g57810 isoform X2 [Tanacetum cinerariifolium]
MIRSKPTVRTEETCFVVDFVCCFVVASVLRSVWNGHERSVLCSPIEVITMLVVLTGLYVTDEFVNRRVETEWFIEGEFDSYASQMRKTHAWGGEPELLMASFILHLPAVRLIMYNALVMQFVVFKNGNCQNSH